ncbi:DUF6199 family natural product biosynthesis protein [Evansella tamaricis]|uniref:DUF6199 domain-containing protein n=1 Tax=Evansella tamaricis TaxID=2069301 RepID=A0ABS6JHN6_9BACI|nr:DUF6199 family natural product biosynthesis protein [Evansella tamaricis]MBU9711848.1 hypothetical protein [Evansella tamaricis]
MVLLGIILIIIGVTMIIKPSIIWLITESWKSNDGTEPSNFYNWSTRFGGILMTLAGIGGVIVTYL